MNREIKTTPIAVIAFSSVFALFVVMIFGICISVYGVDTPPPTETPDITTTETPATAAPKSLEVIATAYCPCVKCCGKDDGITATGTKATAGRTIAVDPSIIPYGTEITINGHTYIAEDCGGAVKGNKVDIFFNTHQEALNFGKQTVTAYYY